MKHAFQHPERTQKRPGAWSRRHAPKPARHLRQAHGWGARCLVAPKKSKSCDFLWKKARDLIPSLGGNFNYKYRLPHS